MFVADPCPRTSQIFHGETPSAILIDSLVFGPTKILFGVVISWQVRAAPWGCCSKRCFREKWRGSGATTLSRQVEQDHSTSHKQGQAKKKLEIEPHFVWWSIGNLCMSVNKSGSGRLAAMREAL
jgi:hypothetical protein